MISAAVLLLIWLLTQWVERRRDERQHRGESVAEVIKATVGLMGAPTVETFDEKKRRYWGFCQSLAAALIVFASREMPKHRNVAEWALRVGERIQDLAPAYRDAQDVSELKPISEHVDDICTILADQLTDWLADGNDKRFKTLEPLD